MVKLPSQIDKNKAHNFNPKTKSLSILHHYSYSLSDRLTLHMLTYEFNTQNSIKKQPDHPLASLETPNVNRSYPPPELVMDFPPWFWLQISPLPLVRCCLEFVRQRDHPQHPGLWELIQFPFVHPPSPFCHSASSLKPQATLSLQESNGTTAIETLWSESLYHRVIVTAMCVEIILFPIVRVVFSILQDLPPEPKDVRSNRAITYANEDDEWLRQAPKYPLSPSFING